MLHITQRSVEWGLYFNQISLIQDKIKYFFFSRNVFASNFANWKSKKFCFEKKENYKSYQLAVFQLKWNWTNFHTLFLSTIHNYVK